MRVTESLGQRNNIKNWRILPTRNSRLLTRQTVDGGIDIMILLDRQTSCLLSCDRMCIEGQTLDYESPALTAELQVRVLSKLSGIAAVSAGLT